MLNNENIYLFILQGDGKIKLGPFEKAYKDWDNNKSVFR